MDLKTLQENFGKALKAAEDIRSKYAGSDEQMPAEDQSTWSKHLDEAESIKGHMEIAEREEKLREWSTSSSNAVPGAGIAVTGEDQGEGAKTEHSEFITLAQTNPRLYRGLKAAETPAYRKALGNYIRAKGELSLLNPTEVKTLSEGTDTAGGFLVPEDFRAELIKKLQGLTCIRPNARVFTTSRDVLTFPKVNYTTDDKYTSGVRLTWTGEIPAGATTADVTDPVFGEERIPVNTAMAGMKLTNDMVEDEALDIMGLCNDLMTEAFALGENDSFINGSGIGRPEGVLNTGSANAIGTVSTGVNGDFAASNKGDKLIELFYAVPAQYRRNCVWIMNSNTAKAVRQFKDGQGRYLWDDMQRGGLLTNGFQEQILGRPVYIDEFMPDYTTTGNLGIFFGDLSGYYIAERVGLSLQVLKELYAESNQVKIIARRRVGGGIAEQWRMKALKFS